MYKPVPQRSASGQVAEQLRRLVEEGHLKPGDKLPSEQELARQFQVGRSSVREAIKTLSTLGILEVRHGRGTFVVQTTSKVDPLSWLIENRDNVLDLLEVREALEAKAAWLAAQLATEAEAEELFDLTRQMEVGFYRGTPLQAEIIDRYFHDRLAEMSRNPLLHELTRMINAAMSDRQAVLSLPGRLALSVQEHYAIAEAIRAHDAEAARDLMIAHIESVKECIRQLRLEEMGEVMNHAGGDRGDVGRPHGGTEAGANSSHYGRYDPARGGKTRSPARDHP